MSKEIPCQKCGHVWLWAGWKKQKDAFCPEGHGCNSKTKDSIEQLAATNEELEAELKYWVQDSADAWDKCEENRLKLAKAVKLMELSVELATWNTTLLEDVIDFITELKGQDDE